MKVAIFAEGSQTTADTSANTVTDHFQGTFQPVSTLERDLSEYANTELHILSEQYGYLLGESSLESISKENVEMSEAKRNFADAIVTAAEDADAVVVLLSSSTFKNTITPRWDEIVSSAQKDTIWCFGASESALQSIELPALEDKVNTVLVYERVGVAPLGQKTRDKLLQQVRGKVTRSE